MLTRKLISIQKSIIPSCDVPDLKALENLIKNTCGVKGIGGYKVGMELANPYGLIEVVKIIKAYTNLPIIFDQQKAGNDIPDTGVNFAKGVSKSGIDCAILFPFTSPDTQIAWTKACQDEGLAVMVGGHMTHTRFLASEGGYIADDAPKRIYTQAAENGVVDFVVPGNKIDIVSMYRELLESILGKNEFTLYAPGFLTQNGIVSEMNKVAGDNWHAIVGRGITGVEDMKKAAEMLASQIGIN